ncbi:hypothetical protein B0G62_102158 [Paraburkholderia eburnea]|uniref:DUF1376 domain-containing protein n=1 Tax=Paraburkholderia eburnea TaxID=1189126 RepID=A0A2S4MIJ2_9BURK|nr:hypothetical protein [Paraburkholderia eburnea]POR54550.1 hypothetical protein B0G62_102158 [Paraburkholderia eburnea]PRZ19765.1 hypothetical protein BX588_114158 [Paraburkholderia eburnea]
MNTKVLPWFRMYTDFLNDPKMISLAFEDQRHFIAVLALKAAGVIDQQCAPELLDRIVAQRIWIDFAIVRDVKKRLVAAGLIDESWQPSAWAKRQMRSDTDPTNAERQRRHRNKKGGSAEEGHNEPGNGDSNALHNGDVTDLDKSREDKSREEENKETHTRERGASASQSSVDNSDVEGKPLTAKDLVAEGVVRAHARDWLALRKAKRLPLTPTAWDGVKAEAEACGMTPAAAVKFAVEQDWAGFKAKWVAAKAATGAPAASRASGAPNKQEALEANNRAVAERAAARFQAQQGAVQ